MLGRKKLLRQPGPDVANKLPDVKLPCVAELIGQRDGLAVVHRTIFRPCEQEVRRAFGRNTGGELRQPTEPNSSCNACCEATGQVAEGDVRWICCNIVQVSYQVAEASKRQCR